MNQNIGVYMSDMKDRSVYAGQILFQDIVNRNGMGGVRSEVNPDMSIFDMGAPTLWLAPWMARMDNLWTVIAGERLWTTYYANSKDSASGMVVHDVFDDNGNPVDEMVRLGIKGRDEYNGESEDGVPVSLRYLVGELSFAECFEINNNMANLRSFDMTLSEVGNNIYFPLDFDGMIRNNYFEYLVSTHQAIMTANRRKRDVEKTMEERSKIRQGGIAPAGP